MLISVSITFSGLCVSYQNISESNLLLCPNDCGRLYSGIHRQQNLKKHLKLECGVAPMFSCRICNRRFTRKENLKRHIILRHRILKIPF